VTDDHVPPECLFAPPRIGLITVPCCETCRHETGKDDEYFRIALSRRADAASHPSLIALQPDIERSLQRPEAQRFAARIERETERATVTLPGGEVVSVGWFTLDYPKVARVVERTARGLYFREQGRKVPDNFQVTILPEPLIPHAADILGRVQAEPRTEIGHGEFAFQGSHLRHERESEREASVWLLTFYGAVPFLVLVTPMESPWNFWRNPSR
jgi:hypothetical protein